MAELQLSPAQNAINGCVKPLNAGIYVLEHRLIHQEGLFLLLSHTDVCAHRKVHTHKYIVKWEKEKYLYHNVLLPQFCYRDARMHGNGTEKQWPGAGERGCELS